MRPGGRTELWCLIVAAVSSCAVATSASCGDLEIKAEASDRGAHWFQDDDGRATGRLALTSEPELNHAITFRAANLDVPFGVLEVHGGVGRVETSDALTFDRLLYANDLFEDNTAVGVGVVERMFNGRLTVSTDLSWSVGTSLWRNGAASNAFEVSDTGGAARWHKLEAKLIESPGVKWTLTGELKSVDDGYTGNAAVRPRGSLAMRGETQKVSSELAAFGVTALVSSEHIANPSFDRATDKCSLGFDGIEATLTSKTLERMSLTDVSQWTSRKAVQGVSVDITPELVVPGALAGSTLLPELISLSWEAGSLATPSGPASTERVANFDVLASWETALGSTTAFYSTERQGRQIAGQGFAGDRGQIFDLSHAIKFGAWRVSAAASMTAFQSASPDDAFADDALSGRFQIRYAPEQGPALEASLGRLHDEFAIETEDEDMLTRFRATTLAVSLDVSQYVQRQWDRRDLSLKLDYRHELKQSERAQEALPSEARSRNADTLLIAFGAPL